MKKVLFKILLLFITLSTSALAEESGVILGFSVGYGNEKIKASMPTSTAFVQLVDGSRIYDSTTSGGGVDIGAILGYKFFFTPSLGLRAYGNFNYQPEFSDSTGDTKITLMNYGVNLDFLYNFLSSENYDMGLFVGLGLGGNTFGGDTISKLEKSAKVVRDGVDLSTTGFDMGLNIGLRANLYKYFGIELGARVPFVSNKIASVDFAKLPSVDGSNILGTGTLSVKRNYSINAKLVFSF